MSKKKKCPIRIVKGRNGPVIRKYIEHENVSGFRFLIETDASRRHWNIYRQHRRMSPKYEWGSGTFDMLEAPTKTLAIALAAYHLGQISRA